MEKNNSKNKVIVIAIVLILLVIAILGALKAFNGEDSKENNDNSNKAPFIMPITEVYRGNGEVYIDGTIERGTLKINDEIQIIGLDLETVTTSVVDIQKIKTSLSSATVGDKVTLTLKNVDSKQIKRGQVVVFPNTMITAKKFSADIHMFTENEGGRHTPINNNYLPQFYFWIASSSGKVTLADGVKQINPGDKNKITVELTTSLPMEIGTEFKIREGGRTVGEGKVTKIY